MKTLALFDLDYTLLAGDSDHAWGEFLAEQGVVDGIEHRRQNNLFWAEYKAGTLDINAYLTFALRPLAGKTDAELGDLHARYMRDKIGPMISEAALSLIEKHRGDLCAIVTATNAFVTRPIAARFGVQNLIACDVEMRDGRYTGNPVGLPSFRAGKVTRVEQWLATLGTAIEEFDDSWFYSDSLNDLPLLQRVNRPVAVNPDATLRQFAVDAGWPILDLISEKHD
jgi:HAD superfamily hydrolase (TIGR01490 family)